MNTLAKITVAGVIGCASVLLSGCNTARGIGEDTHIAYDAIRDAVSESDGDDPFYGDEYSEYDDYNR